MATFNPEGWITDIKASRSYFENPLTLQEAMSKEEILESRAVVCDGEHNLIVDLGCMRGVIPREEGAIGIKEGLVRDIAIISKVNKPVCFVVKGFKKTIDGQKIAVLSRRLAQEKCMQDYINLLGVGDVINAKVTHLEPFGAFVDIGCGVISLLPIDMISVSRIDHPRERFGVGMKIKAIVRGRENGRITLTHKELLGTWEENANNFTIGETVTGIIRSVEDYGAFVELAPNLAGLAETKDGIKAGQQASVYIKNIIPSRMKVKLIVIETFDNIIKPLDPLYFYKDSHINEFVYSPKESIRISKTIFNQLELVTKETALIS